MSLAAPQREALLRASRPYSPSFIASRAPNVKVNLLLHQWLPPSLPARFHNAPNQSLTCTCVKWRSVNRCVIAPSNVPSLLLMYYNNISFRDVTINAHLFPTADAQSHTAGGDMANELLITTGAGSDLVHYGYGSQVWVTSPGV